MYKIVPNLFSWPASENFDESDRGIVYSSNNEIGDTHPVEGAAHTTGWCEKVDPFK